MGLMHLGRRAAQRVGLDVRRYPETDPAYRRVVLLRHTDADLVLDVGANKGQTGHQLRNFGYERDIASFEPTTLPFAALQRSAAHDLRWRTYKIACGDRDGDVTMNLAANSGASSSILPMHDNHIQVAPNAGYVASEPVELRRLDGLQDHFFNRAERIFLKADVQGYERAVVEGAIGLMERIVGLQLEVSLVPLYENGMLYHEAIELARGFGFELAAFEDSFYHPVSGRLMWGDATFIRPL